MAEGSKTSIYISRALCRCRQRSSSEDVRLDSEQIMTLLERKPLLNSSWSTFYVNAHTRWSVFMDFYMIIWQFLCTLEVLKCETHFWGLFVCFPAAASFKGCVYAAIYSLQSSGCTKKQQVDHNSLPKFSVQWHINIQWGQTRQGLMNKNNPFSELEGFNME